MPVKNVEEYIDRHPNWQEELKILREMMLDTPLEETIKWGGPVYCLNGKNVAGIAAFKNHCALWFFNGALLKQNTALLQNAQEGKTKALRQIKFTKEDKIRPEILINYVNEAIQNQREGKEIKPNTNKKLIIPPEFLAELDKNPALLKAFDKLTTGKQREYADYINEAKKEATKQKRLKKIIPMILEGKGLYEKYKNC
ncbi:YdeI/OmpD-associated family protein [Salegentibacter chungangensis]|uniref:YdeI family protein n=1 Tax=Salegentibacter chungangensis TaxID=1335724 RepID=A0ABW3NVV1_9FLAO